MIAAGAVPLALFAYVVDIRMTQWASGAKFVVVGLIALFLLTMGWLAQLEGETPRPYHSVLLVSALATAAVALPLLARLLGASHPPGTGAYVWTFALLAGIAAACARRANSAVCTLIAALVAAIAGVAFIVWVFKPHGIGTFRAIILVISLIYGGVTLSLRDRHRRHAVQFVNAAGLLTALLIVTLAEEEFLATVLRGQGGALVPGAASASFGWKLYALAAGFGLVAYSCVDREPGPGYIGALVLVLFAVLVGVPSSGHGSLVGWPLFLLALGAVGMAIGLRPRQPLPPEPGPLGPPAPVVQASPPMPRADLSEER